MPHLVLCMQVPLVRGVNKASHPTTNLFCKRSNEHTNGLLRQFFPKGTNFKTVNQNDLNNAVDLINHRPRKSLDYRTPYEVFYSQSSAPLALQI